MAHKAQQVGNAARVVELTGRANLRLRHRGSQNNKTKSRYQAPIAIDLFAGAGGLASSLEASGWRTVATVDTDKDAVATLRRNQERGSLRHARIILGDVREITGRDLRPPNARVSWRPDILAGGPPCQPFSSSGRMRGFEDPRGGLFHEFVRLADELKPRFVLFENVAGLVTAKTPDGEVGGVLRRIQREFESIGYACRFELLNAADFGAAQRRVRLYMIGSRRERLPEFPRPTHSKEGALDRYPWVSLTDFLTKHPPTPPEDIVRPHPNRAAALAALEPGTGLKSGGIVEANRPGGHWGYRQDCFVADLRMPSRTIRAAATPDWLQLAGGLRRLSWRECASLQGFPVDWEFEGSTPSRFRQIGNAVQGNVGRAIGAALLASATEARKCKPVSAPWPSCFHKRVKYTAMEEVVNGAHRRAAKERSNAIDATALA